MKKLLLFFPMVAVAFLTTGCGIGDAVCITQYKIVNRAGGDIVVDVGRGENTYQSTSIESGVEEMIYDFETLCGKNHVSIDYHAEDKKMENLWIKVNGEPISDDLWKRKYWEFAAIRYETTYTLILTDELLEEMRQQEEL